MTISSRVQGDFFGTTKVDGTKIMIRMAPMIAASKTSRHRRGTWTTHEHNRFLAAMERYPSGPWRLLADYIGTKTARQTMTHAQKYRQKIARWKSGSTIRLGPGPRRKFMRSIGIGRTPAPSSALLLQPVKPPCVPGAVASRNAEVEAETAEGTDEEMDLKFLDLLLDECDYQPLELPDVTPSK